MPFRGTRSSESVTGSPRLNHMGGSATRVRHGCSGGCVRQGLIDGPAERTGCVFWVVCSD